jgi:hypothetical protein
MYVYRDPNQYQFAQPMAKFLSASNFQSFFFFTVPLMCVSNIRALSKLFRVLPLFQTFIRFKAVFFSPDRSENVRTLETTPKISSNLACGSLQRKVKLPAPFNRLLAAYESVG